MCNVCVGDSPQLYNVTIAGFPSGECSRGSPREPRPHLLKGDI